MNKKPEFSQSKPSREPLNMLSGNQIQHWVRICQECSHVNRAKEPNKEQELTDSYRNSKCRKCKSEGLDYGKYWTKTEIEAQEKNRESLFPRTPSRSL